MTDRFYAFTVILKNDTREDDVEHIINAIKMIKGVQCVKPHVTNVTLITAEERAKKNLKDKIWKIFHPDSK